MYDTYISTKSDVIFDRDDFTYKYSARLSSTKNNIFYPRQTIKIPARIHIAYCEYGAKRRQSDRQSMINTEYNSYIKQIKLRSQRPRLTIKNRGTS